MNVYSSSNPSEVQQKDFQYNLIPKKQTITQLKLNGINYLQFCVISFWQSHEIPSLRCGRVYTELWSRKLGTAVGNMCVVRHALSTASSEATLRCDDHFKVNWEKQKKSFLNISISYLILHEFGPLVSSRESELLGMTYRKLTVLLRRWIVPCQGHYVHNATRSYKSGWMSVPEDYFQYTRPVFEITT